MQIVIEIPEDYYYKAKHGFFELYDIREVRDAIANGIPLPKGHGRLIDDRSIRVKPEYMQSIMGMAVMRVEDLVRVLNDTPTVILADKEDKK